MTDDRRRFHEGSRPRHGAVTPYEDCHRETLERHEPSRPGQKSARHPDGEGRRRFSFSAGYFFCFRALSRASAAWTNLASSRAFVRPSRSIACGNSMSPRAAACSSKPSVQTTASPQ